MSENNPDHKSTDKIRLNKLIAHSGLFSRRDADKVIADGRVMVNGKKVYELGIRVDPNQDRIIVDGKPLKKSSFNLYLLFYKPRGILTTMHDPLERPTIKNYLDEVPQRVYPVGRLDWDSEGLILLTNDGEFAQRVTHPKYDVTKTYLVKVSGKPEAHHIAKLLRGVSIIGGKVAAKYIEKIRPAGEKKSDKYDWFKVIITEGKNRQIRQMFAKIGLDVLKLQRVSIGRLRAGAMKPGDLVYLNEAAVERVFLQDLPEQVKEKKSYKGRAPSKKKNIKTGKQLIID